VADSAKILVDILQNQGTLAQTQAVVANAAMALHCAEPSLPLPDAVLKARESLESGQAYEAFKALVA
jgi:anthranilate phosphoribosyltransferase